MIKKLHTHFFYTLFISFITIIIFSNSAKAESFQSDTDSLEVISISDINYNIEKAKRTISRITFDDPGKKELVKIDSSLNSLKIFLETQSDEFYSFNETTLSKVFLANTYRIWNGYNSRLKRIQKTNNNRFKRTDEDARTLISLSKSFTKTRNELNREGDYQLILQRIDELLSQIDQKKKENYTFINNTIRIEDKITELLVFIDHIIGDTQRLLDQKKINTFKRTNPFIWQTTLDDGKYSDAKSRASRAWYENKKLIINNFELIKADIPLFTIYSILIIFIVFFTRKGYISLNYTNEDDSYVSIKRILLDNPIELMLTFLLFLFLLMFPSTPILLSNALTAVLLLVLTRILRNSISNTDTQLIFSFFIILILHTVEILAWYFSGYARIYFVFEIGISIFLLYDYKVKHLDNNKITSEISKIAKIAIPIFLGLYGLSMLSQIIGFMNLSITINKALSLVPVISLIIFAAFKIFSVFITAISKIAISKFPIIQIIVPNHLKIIKVFNKFFLIFIWMMLIANSFQFDRGVDKILSNFLTYSIAFSSFSITLGDFISFIIIIGVTIFLTQLISKFFENDLIKKGRKTPRGFFAATSLSIRMLVVFIGLTFSMSMLGVNLSKFSMMAGALGVGIGFGLQDIVNNFISGMILIYGRPIQVGDTIEVDTLLGIVKNIGIRSSVITTYDGAEVLVPNSMLITNKLTNWTLSDNKKRMEVFIGVEYGSDLEEVIEIMLESTKGIDIVLRDPSPQALFMDFGDSSLNFRLRFWVSYEDGYTARSEVSIVIYKMLAEKNITIPFPQLDVHHFNDAEESNIEESIPSITPGIAPFNKANNTPEISKKDDTDIRNKDIDADI